MPTVLAGKTAHQVREASFDPSKNAFITAPEIRFDKFSRLLANPTFGNFIFCDTVFIALDLVYLAICFRGQTS